MNDILIIEDDVIIAETLKIKLDSFGYAAEVANSGEEAWEDLKAFSPDIILLDINLGQGINGIDLAEKIKKEHPIPVIFLTAYSDIKLFEKAKTMDPYGYILKPYKDIDIRNAIEISLHRLYLEKQVDINFKNLETFFNNLDDLFFIIDYKNIIIEINPAVVLKLKYERDEIIGKTIDFVHPEESSKKLLEILEKLIIQDAVFSEIPLKTKDNVLFPAETRFTKGFWGNNQVIFGFAHDFSLQKKLQEEIEKSKRLESIGLLAGGLAHNFNNLNQSIYGYISLAIEELESYPECEAKIFLEKALKTLPKSVELANQLITFAKGGNQEFIIGNIKDIIFECINPIKMQDKIIKEINISSNLLNIKYDKELLCLAFRNIIQNSVDAMPDGGKIIIEIMNETIFDDSFFQEKYYSNTLKKGKYILLFIKDTGTGIAPENINKIFDVFFTTDFPNKQGLGLAVSKSIIQKIDGDVFVESVQGSGTTCFIYIPAYVENKELTPDKSVSEIKEQKRKYKILFMDDDESILDFAVSFFQKTDFRYDLAKNGFEAIEKYKMAIDSGDFYDLVILDYIIPGSIDATETFKRLKEIDPNIRSILSTGYLNDPIVKKYNQYGFIDLIQKPFSLKEIRDKIDKSLIKY